MARNDDLLLFGYESAVVVTPAVVATTVAIPTPLVSVPVDVSPAVVATVVAAPAPAILAGAVVTPVVVAAITTLPTPTINITTGTVTVTPAVVAVITTVPTPTPSIPGIAIPATIELGGIGYLDFPPLVSASATSPDHVTFDLINDLEIKVLARLSSTGQMEVLLTKGDVDNDTAASFELTHDTGGDDSLTFRWRNSATTLITWVSDASLVTQDDWKWYRVTVVYQMFLSQYEVKFWFSNDAPSTAPAAVNWTQHTLIVEPGGPDIQVSTDPLTIGLPAEDWMVARIGYVELRDHIEGHFDGSTIVASPDFRDRDQWNSDTQLTDSQGHVWTINPPASWYTGLAFPNPTVHAAATVTPATVALTATIPAPAPLAGAVVVPVTVATTVTVPTPTITAAPTVTPGVIALGGTNYVANREDGGYVATPHHASFNGIDDIDIRVCVYLPNPETSDTYQPLVSKDAGFLNYSFFFTQERQGGVTKGLFGWSDTGNDREIITSVGAGDYFLAGTHWYRFTLDSDDGAGGRVGTFYRSSEPPTTDPTLVNWVVHEVVDQGLSGNGIDDSTAPVEIARNVSGAPGDFDGHIYYVEIRNSIGGTIVANPDFRDRDQWNSDTQFTDSQGRVWTVNSPASWYSGLYLPTPNILAAAIVTPVVVPLVTALPTPTIDVAGGPVTVTPAVVATTAAVATPSISAAVLVAPVVIPLVSDLPAPTINVAGAGAVTPSTVATTVSIPTPTVSIPAVVTPASISVVVDLSTPSITSAATALPAVVPLVTTLPTPQVTAEAVVTPATVGLIVVIPVPDITLAMVVAPAVIAILSTLPQPSITAAALVAPDGIVLVAALPTPGLIFPIFYTDQRDGRDYNGTDRDFADGDRVFTPIGRSHSGGGRGYRSGNRDYR